MTDDLTDDERFEAEKAAAGLYGDWEYDDGDRYLLTTAWWQSFSVVGGDGDWVVYEYDHDSGVDEKGQSTTSFEQWDEHYSSWTEAAKVIEERYVR